jgi:hypothetical protein
VTVVTVEHQLVFAGNRVCGAAKGKTQAGYQQKQNKLMHFQFPLYNLPFMIYYSRIVNQKQQIENRK